MGFSPKFSRNQKNDYELQSLGIKLLLTIHRTRGKTEKDIRLRVDPRKKFFPKRVLKHWHRFPREVVNAPSLKTQSPDTPDLVDCRRRRWTR